MMVNRIVGLLETGAIMGQKFEVYESHIPYLLQFLVDYNLYGMEFIHLSFFKIRLSKENNRFQIKELDDSMYWNQPSSPDRQSYCEIEMDTWPGEIMNRLWVKERPDKALVKNLDATVPNSDIPLVPSLAAIWNVNDENARRDKMKLPRLNSDTLPTTTQRQPYIPWVNETQLRDKLNELLRTKCQITKHEKLINNVPRNDILTVFAAISYLHPPLQSFDTVAPKTNVNSSQTSLSRTDSFSISDIEKLVDQEIVIQQSQNILTQNDLEMEAILEDMVYLDGMDEQDLHDCYTPEEFGMQDIGDISSIQIDESIAGLELEPRLSSNSRGEIPVVEYEAENNVANQCSVPDKFGPSENRFDSVGDVEVLNDKALENCKDVDNPTSIIRVDQQDDTFQSNSVINHDTDGVDDSANTVDTLKDHKYSPYHPPLSLKVKSTNPIQSHMKSHHLQSESNEIQKHIPKRHSTKVFAADSSPFRLPSTILATPGSTPTNVKHLANQNIISCSPLDSNTRSRLLQNLSSDFDFNFSSNRHEEDSNSTVSIEESEVDMAADSVANGEDLPSCVNASQLSPVKNRFINTHHIVNGDIEFCIQTNTAQETPKYTWVVLSELSDDPILDDYLKQKPELTILVLENLEKEHGDSYKKQRPSLQEETPMNIINHKIFKDPLSKETQLKLLVENENGDKNHWVDLSDVIDMPVVKDYLKMHPNLMLDCDSIYTSTVQARSSLIGLFSSDPITCTEINAAGSNERHPPGPIVLNGELEYFVEKILDHKRDSFDINHHKYLFYVQWKGYSLDQCSWLPLEEVNHTVAFEKYISEHPGLFLNSLTGYEVEEDPVEDVDLTPKYKKKTSHRMLPQNDGADDDPKDSKRKKLLTRFSKPKRVRFDLTSDPMMETKIFPQRDGSIDIKESWPKQFSKNLNSSWSPARKIKDSNWSFFCNPPNADSPSSSHVQSSSISDAVYNSPLKRHNVVLDHPNRADCFSQSTEMTISLDKRLVTPILISSPVYNTKSIKTRLHRFNLIPPSAAHLFNTLQMYDQPQVEYQSPFFSNSKDTPLKPFIYGGKEFIIKNKELSNLQPFDTSDVVRTLWNSQSSQGKPAGKIYHGFQYWKNRFPLSNKLYNVKFLTKISIHRRKIWTLPKPPLNRKQAENWIQSEYKALEGWLFNIMLMLELMKTRRRKRIDMSQVEKPTPMNTHDFKYSTPLTDAINDKQMIIRTRENLAPDFTKDPVRCLFYCFFSTNTQLPTNGKLSGCHVGMISIRDKFSINRAGLNGFSLEVVETEKEMIECFYKHVRIWDPDVLLGYEIQTFSWGYLIHRANEYKIHLCEKLSRIVPKYSHNHYEQELDAWGAHKQSSLHSSGRIFINVWRILRQDISLTSYTIENMWYDHGMLMRWRTMKYYLDRVQFNIELLEKIDEFAKVYGIDFYSVVTRGSQYKVESVMARIARPENFVMLSPSRAHVCELISYLLGEPNECSRMEPQSKFYTSPVLVLDFQSLYPSLMIAYNLCYSTILGRVKLIGSSNPLGAKDDFMVDPSVIEELKDHINITPNGVVFVKSHVRQGVLSRMVSEILDTRVMVKQSMKLYKDNKSLLRILDAKQLGLKLLANVTFGYTAASYSGRMPCVKPIGYIGKGNLSLFIDAFQSIELIHSRSNWNARVVYGDTDSLFVALDGTSKDTAFTIGEQIVNTITNMNPKPIKLKFEKVYHPCMLLAKKRYVGFKYELPTDNEPVFDAKGIETVRRDGCFAVAKSLENCLKILFRSKDLSELKKYLYKEWTKILTGNVNIQDFIIAKEVKSKTLPPGAHLSVQNMKKDDRSEPQYKERVPYVVVHAGPKHRLIDAVVSPYDLLYDQSLRLHRTYYITKQMIGPLSRVFNLVGVDIEAWYNEMPKKSRAIDYIDTGETMMTRNRNTIDHYYKSAHCLVCNILCVEGMNMFFNI
ncbi:DNA polymerase zeta [Globomyces sp. JEL0801]|nr:DNA polymerase zeta [Globomyces sp. JEL0801]